MMNLPSFYRIPVKASLSYGPAYAELVVERDTFPVVLLRRAVLVHPDNMAKFMALFPESRR